MSIVKVTQVQRTYEQGSHKVYALRGVDLSIEKGEFTVLMGSSG
jgi:putative ABC transport system ATP-binding protein